MKKTLFNPFEKYSEKQLFVTGITMAAVCSLVAYYLNARFDGILDMHIVKNVRFDAPFIDNLINIVTLTLLLFAAALIVNKKTRIIDILNTVLIARIIYCFLPIFNPEFISPGIDEKLLSIDPKDPQSLNLTALDYTAIGITAIVMIGALVWYIALLYNGFKTASNSKKITHTIAFILAIIIAEIVSSLLISTIN
ncbi:hypothetical protein FUA48_07830 [Flavobacterium alkalisoli]|uniref:Yip1 domain-containing protein n=1 Tax=Flavobacterium alkalisoli TaxID=2602769 RepID=A0A5B9FQC0_9FLAO|nr:hypothetical protein [Flavobacterium alkalisoli]QEE49493.1 hypothetical protein FUA48_07830 [Flavobacterium alkalisoli]